MNWLLYYFASAMIALLQTLPINWVARFGRLLGGLFYLVDARHRNVARKNLTLTFGNEKSEAEINEIARENFKRIGENFATSVKLAGAKEELLWDRLEIVGAYKLTAQQKLDERKNIILTIGHFGNFELFANINKHPTMPRYKLVTTYRAVRNPAIDKVLQKLRNSTGCVYYERRTEGTALRLEMSRANVMVGLLADQHSGNHGVRLPFFGRECTTSKAPALFGLRYNAPVHVAICYRTGLARWRIEMGDEIPTAENGKSRTVHEIMLDVNRAYEAAIRRDPANWFWVHNRWKNPTDSIARRQTVTAAEEPEE